MFLATKLFLPPLPAGAVHRDRLYSALDESWAGGSRLLLLSAPPGYGKTTLLSVWVQQRGIPCAWVSLEASDSDPARFFLLLLRVLKPFLPALESLEPVLKLPKGADFESLAAEVINAAVELKQPLLLALDDYHAISSSTVHDLVQFLLDHLPPHLRLAVLTREDPPFHLARMRARRQMLELRAAELAFSTPEGETLLIDAQGLTLDCGQIERVLERTEGWAAGLQLVSLTLRGHPDPARVIESFSGSHHYVFDYLFTEVLDRLPADLRTFLCRSAVLDRFDAGLCDAALQTSDSRAQIAHAAAANLFLIPLDEERAWFRYHHLMGEILKAEVPLAERQAIQQRAARWWMAQDQPVEAVRCALEARDDDLAVTLIQAAALPAAESGLLITALGWLDALPEEVLRGNPELSVYRAWFLVLAGRFPEALAWLGKLAERSADLPRPLAGLLASIQGWMVSTAGQRMDLTALREAYARTEGRYPYFSPLMLLVIGQAQREAGDLAGALESFRAGTQLAEQSSGPVSALIISNNQAFLLDEMGERRAAIQICRENVERFTDAAGKPGLLAGVPLLPLGCFLYRSGDLEGAYTTLTQGINLVRRLGLYDVLTAPANHTLEYVLADQGRLDEALALNREVRRRAARVGLQVVVTESDWMAGWLQLRAGNIAPAVEWTLAHPLPTGSAVTSDQQTGIFLHARVLSAAGHWEQARDLMLPVLEYTRKRGLLSAWVRASVELALIYHAAGQIEAAAGVLAPAFDAAVGMDYRQVFRHAVGVLGALYEPFRARYPGFVESICARPEERASTAHPQASVLVEPLTERELEILRLVSAGQSNAEIAQRLYLTVGTVKWYLNQLFGKLGVNRRTEAVARARGLGLI